MKKQIVDNVRTSSRPSGLTITDVRVAALQLTPGHWFCPLVRIDTNQGIYGIGEVRDGASKNYALMLKRLLVGAFYPVSDAPGLGIEVNEELIARQSFKFWEAPHLKRNDGSVTNW